MTSVISDTVIGIAVRLTTSNGETLPMLDATTITAVIGDMARAELAAKCIGSSMTTGATPILAATPGIIAAKAKNGALPEPMMIEQTMMMPVVTMIMPAAPKSETCAAWMIESIVPIVC